MQKTWLVVPIGMVVGWISTEAQSPPKNPVVNSSGTFEAAVAPPPDISALLRRACYDCHSNETRWPWYSRLPPVSWIVRKDVTSGRKAVNFSEWKRTYGQTPATSSAMLMAACANLRSGRMPKPNYLILHPEAKLKDAEIERFCQWAGSQAQQPNSTLSSFLSRD